MKEAREHTVVQAVLRALTLFDLTGRVRDGLPPRPPARARVRVVAAGKAAPAMVRGVLDRWPGRVEQALVVVPDETPTSPVAGDACVRFLRAAHPLPDARSVEAASQVRALAAGKASDLLVVLISGGASSLLCSPAPGLTLEDKRACTAALLASGAAITEVNTVRRHLSQIKGGGLARAAYPSRVLALLASDVIVGASHDIGSGPTVVDPTTASDARAVLRARAPSFAALALEETLKETAPAARRQRFRVVASPLDFARAVAEELRAEGRSVRVLEPSTAEASDLARQYTPLARLLQPGEAVVRSAEPGVVMAEAAHGRGGRASHIAALVALDLPPGVVFLALATDGVDGSSYASGALVDASLVADVGAARLEEALDRFDTGGLHETAATSVSLGPTGLNFADVHVLARSP